MSFFPFVSGLISLHIFVINFTRSGVLFQKAFLPNQSNFNGKQIPTSVHKNYIHYFQVFAICLKAMCIISVFILNCCLLSDFFQNLWYQFVPYTCSTSSKFLVSSNGLVSPLKFGAAVSCFGNFRWRILSQAFFFVRCFSMMACKSSSVYV